MRAAVLHGPEDLRVEEVPEPTPGFGEVKFRNAYSGICGSDLHVVEDPSSLSMDLNEPHPITGACLPQILGHEFSGTVVELGDGVDGVSVGDRAAVFPSYVCGRCASCRTGRSNACAVRGLHGMHARGGGLAAYTTVPASMLHLLPAAVDLRMGALVQPLAVSWHGVRLADPQPGDTAAIIGGGPVGIGVWLALRARGVERILVSEPHSGRRTVLSDLGAEVVDPTRHDPAEAVLAMTAGIGVTAAFEAAGVSRAFHTAIGCVAPGGSVVVLGLHTAPRELSLMSLIEKEIAVRGSSGYLPEDFEDVISAMAAGHVDLSGWVEEVGLEETPAAVRRLSTGSGSKILIRSAPMEIV